MKKRILKELSNIPGKRINRKLIVIESDDWGSSRVDSSEMANELKAKGYDTSRCWMSTHDAIERNSDISALASVLQKYKDFKGKNPVFTLLFNPANPNFEKIKEDYFEKYHYVPFTDTLSKYNGTEKVIDYYKEAINQQLFSIDFHGREHLYVNRWLRDLKNNDKVALDGFNIGFWGFSYNYAPNIKHAYRSAFDLDFESDLISQKASITEGISLIKEIFNYTPRFFVAPDGPYSLALNETLSQNGINTIGLSKSHIEPLGEGNSKKHFFYLGKKLNTSLITTTRNVIFEPGKHNGTDWLDAALKEIESAFRWKKPAVISTHRVNYIGVHSEKYRDENLKSLSVLLDTILTRWPEVEFVTSEQLGNLIDRK